MNVRQLGWNDEWERQFRPYRREGLQPARVLRGFRTSYSIALDDRVCLARVLGKFRHETQTLADFPVVGDWVAVKARKNDSRAVIHDILPRSSAFSRRAAGMELDAQVVAANIDTVFLVSGLDGEFNPRRIERFLTMAWESGAEPVVLLNKMDICEEVASRIEQTRQLAIDLPVLAISAQTGEGISQLESYLKEGASVALLGSSGVGKSSIINRLLGEERQLTGPVREYDDRGRHTTTHRELILLPTGALVIDTPGMREVQLWGDQEVLRLAFSDIIEIAAKCQFRDCSHEQEPGCAVLAAIEAGELDASRMESYRKQKRELELLERPYEMKSNRAVASWRKRKSTPSKASKKKK